MVSISWVNDQIAVGSAIIDEDISLLRQIGLNAVIDVRSECTDNRELIEKKGMEILHVAVDDQCVPTFAQLQEIFDFIQPLLRVGKKVLIHCQNGCGRSPLVAIAVLSKGGMDIPDAVNLVKKRHPKTGFTDNQTRFIDIGLAKYLKEKYKNGQRE